MMKLLRFNPCRQLLWLDQSRPFARNDLLSEWGVLIHRNVDQSLSNEDIHGITIVDETVDLLIKA